MLTKEHRQEALCRVYVRAVAALAGVTVCEPENDYGIDMALRAITPPEETNAEMRASSSTFS